MDVKMQFLQSYQKLLEENYKKTLNYLSRNSQKLFLVRRDFITHCIIKICLNSNNIFVYSNSEVPFIITLYDIEIFSRIEILFMSEEDVLRNI